MPPTVPRCTRSLRMILDVADTMMMLVYQISAVCTAAAESLTMSLDLVITVS